MQERVKNVDQPLLVPVLKGCGELKDAQARTIQNVADLVVGESHDVVWDQLLSRKVERFQAGLVSKAHRLLRYSTLGWRVLKERKKSGANLCLSRRSERAVLS